ncbi:MAG: imidazole glycerol phosphate synthase subunit HisH [Actinomycetota bacterium]
MRIAIINYNMGNIKSVENALKKLQAEVEVTSDPLVIQKADAVILPGVGAFSDGMKNICALGLADVIRQAVDRKPFMGICLGLQLLFDFSLEDGKTDGLKILAGSVERIPPGVKVPHMGWNSIEMLKESPLMEGIENGEHFYFVHSYHAVCKDRSIVGSTTRHGIEIVSSIEKDNVFAFQFHPEKSSASGLRILSNFCKMVQKGKP